MNESIFLWILGIAGTVILLLLSVVGYFLRQNFLTNREVRISTQKLNTTIRVLIQKMSNYDEKHKRTEERLNDHSNRIRKNEMDIATLKKIVE